MNIFDTPWLNDSPPAPTGEASLTKGLRSGFLGVGSQLNAFAGAGADALGLTDFAANRFAASRDLAARAAEAAPPVSSFHDVHDLRSGYDYVTGLLGQAAPSVGAAVGGALLTRRAPMLGATLATAPMEAGDITMRQQNDPASMAATPVERLRAAAGGGLLSAAGQAYLPSVVTGQVLGRTAAQAAKGGMASTAGRALTTMGVDAAAGAGGEAAKQAALMQTNPQQEFDTNPMVEAAVGNLVPGAVMAGAGAAAERGHAAAHAAGTSVADLANTGVAKIKDAASQARQKAGEVSDYSRGLFPRSDERVARAVAEDGLIDPLPQGADAAAHVKADDAKATEWVTSKLKGMLDDSSLSPEMKAKADDILSRVHDPAARAEAAAMDLARTGAKKAQEFHDYMAEKGVGKAVEEGAAKAKDMATSAAEAAMNTEAGGKVTQFARDLWDASKPMRDGAAPHIEAAKKFTDDHIAFAKEWWDAHKDGTFSQFNEAANKFLKRDVKKSEDTSGARQVIADAIRPALEKAQPHIAKDAHTTAKAAEGVRRFLMESMDGNKPEQDTRAVGHLRELLGDDAVTVLTSALDALQGSGVRRERAFDTIQSLDENMNAHNAMRGVVQKYLKDQDIRPNDAVEALRRYVRGEHVKQVDGSERAVRERLARREIDAAFGKDADKVLAAFEKEFEAVKAKTEMQESKTGRDEDGDHETGEPHEGREPDLPETTIEREPPRVYRGKNKLAIPTLDEHRRLYGDSESAYERLMKRAQEDNPDRNVSFMSVKDFERDYGEKMDIPHHPDANPERYGVVVAEGMKQEGRITEEQARAMRFDEGVTRSKSRVKLESGDVLDAYKITQHTLKGLPYIEGESGLRRLARAFYDGLGSALDYYGTTVKGALPDYLVLAVRNGAKITYGDVKMYKGKGEYSISAKLDAESEIKDLKRLIAKTNDESKREALLEELDAVQRRAAAQDRVPTESNLGRMKREKGVYEMDPEGNIHEAAMEHERAGTMERKTKIDERAPSTVKTAEPEAKPAQPAEHVPERKRGITDDAKDAVAGGSAGEGVLNRYLDEAKPHRMRALINQINDTKFANKRELRNANDAIERLNAALGEALKKSPELGYSFQLKKDAASVGTKEASEAARKTIDKYVKDVLGDSVKVEWAKMMHAGELDATGQDLVMRLSVHALDPLGTAYHESLHAFFKHLQKMGARDVMDVLVRAASGGHVMKQLREYFKDQPEVLKQLETDAEERVAYMYQLHAKEKLTVGPETKSVIGKIKQFFMKVLGMWTNDERAEHIMNYFHEGGFKDHIGDVSAMRRAIMEPGSNKYVESVKRAIAPLKRMERAVMSSGIERLRDTQVPALMRIADLIHADKTDGVNSDVGYIQASKTERATRMNNLARSLKGVTQDALDEAHLALREGRKANTPEAENARLAIRKALDDSFDYMRSAGVRVNDLGYKADYFPRVWDPDFISRNQDAFRAMLEKYIAKGEFKGNVDQVMARIMGTDGTNLDVVVDRPGMQHTKERKLDFITPEDAAPFVRNNIFQVMNSYISQSARRAEWTRRFQDDGGHMRDLLADAKKQGATKEEIDMAQDFIRGVDGTLGDDISPTMRRMFGNMIVYQNLRLLPLALFSMAVDPMGIVVRGGTVSDAFSAFKRGIMEIPRGFKKDKAKDSWYELAETMGIIEDTALMHAIGSSYTQGMVSDTARRINDKLFQLNGVEQMTTSLRVSATEAAVRFIKKHGDGTYSEHSKRFMDELGLTSKDVVVREDGGLVVTEKGFRDLGYTPAQAAAAANKMRAALNKWVDGAILRPNAAEKPIWMNDPHWALVAHLKQFVYAFQHTVLDRVWHEAAHGNYAPAAALGSYVPIMFAADLVKGMIQGGGEQPEWKKAWGWQQYLGSAVERAGLYGVGQFPADFVRDLKQGGTGVGAVSGPAIEQLIEGIKTVAGREQYSTFVMHSLPANALYSHFFNQPATDPKFAD